MTAATRGRGGVVALLSGGLDSATAAAMVRADGWEVHALSIDYGQRQRAELAAAKTIAAKLPVASFRVVRVDLRTLGGSALTDDEFAVPKDREDEAIAEGIPVTYVPARNTVFLSLALACAETLDADAIVLGVNAIDYSGYPDCRPAFLDAFRAVATTGTKRGVEGRPIAVLAPLLSLSKAEIVIQALALGVPLAETLSCYDPEEQGGGRWAHCGRCDACLLRARGFAAAGAVDPARV